MGIFQFSCFVLLANAAWLTSHSIPQSEHVHYHRPSTSFIHLVGASKEGGDQPGIGNVKKYLHQFGYLNDIEYGVNQIMEDRFDNSLETAILTYQDFFKLNKTGILDQDTISMMSKPRCGSPDLHRVNKSNNFGHQHYKFLPDKRHRTFKSILYQIRESVPIEFKDAIHAAFFDWEPYTPLLFAHLNVGSGSPPDIIVEFFQGEHGDGLPFDGPLNVLAHAHIGLGPMLHFDSAENWKVGEVTGDGIDIGTVARHEIGHLLGLDHSDDKHAIMFPTYQGIMKIGDDDIAGIKALYYG